MSKLKIDIKKVMIPKFLFLVRLAVLGSGRTRAPRSKKFGYKYRPDGPNFETGKKKLQKK